MPVKDSQDGYSFLYPFGWQVLQAAAVLLSWAQSMGWQGVHARARQTSSLTYMLQQRAAKAANCRLRKSSSLPAAVAAPAAGGVCGWAGCGVQGCD